MHKCLQMGCLSSRSTTVSPIDISDRNRNTNDLQQTSTKKPFNSNAKGKQPASNKHQKVANGHLRATQMNNQLAMEDTGGLESNDTGGRLNKASSGVKQIGDTMDRGEDRISADDDIMSILMNDQDRSASLNNEEVDERIEMVDAPSRSSRRPKVTKTGASRPADDSMESNMKRRDVENLADDAEGELKNENEDEDRPDTEQGRDNDRALVAADQQDKSTGENSFDEELNVDLLRQYIIVDYEITQLEDKDALRIYHEKIEQLEQLERELDMISMEAEEVAARGVPGNQFQMQSMADFGAGMKAIGGGVGGLGGDGESNSMLSGLTESVSPKSSFKRNNNTGARANNLQQQVNDSNKSSIRNLSINRRGNNSSSNNGNNGNHNESIAAGELALISANSANNRNSSSYSTVEEVFNRKIVLEKERDKLKKEVELVIIECDKLQNRYKKRDEILDKLFDGRTGNGLENHLEQQLNWLMEQKHYVDQVFYAWKRAETLTSQTCEQFASALELLKRLTKVQDDNQRVELAKNIGQLLLKSRQDMEQAQRYNPNVDAPFFTDTETERFDKIIETISSSQSINQNDYSQIATVIQFAYKRAVSIRLWLEQILQITIARDSFELAEEYKWIAIQLRKERITLIKSKLRDPPYRAMAQAIQEQLAKQNQLSLARGSTTNNNETTNRTVAETVQATGEVNRDSGIESDDIDIEEEIYRLLEMNKSRLEAAVAAGATQQQQQSSTNSFHQLKPDNKQFASDNHNHHQSNQQHHLNDQMMRERIERRVRGEQSLAIATRAPLDVTDSTIMSQLGDGDTNTATTSKSSAFEGSRRSDTTAVGSAPTANTVNQTSATSGTGTPSKIRVELDESTRQKLLKQVDQTHEKHRNKMERLRGNNRAKANDSIMNRVQQARLQQKQHLQDDKSTINLTNNWDGLV